MNHSWDEMVGVTLAGQYELQELLGAEEHGAYYRAAFRGGRAVIELMQESRAEFWQRAAQLDHRHLQRVLDSGTAQGLTYVVFEYPDERLSSGMQGGISKSEAREIVAALRGTLTYLHERGFAHGAVNADHIVAVGETVKLETDTLHDGVAADQATDWRQLTELAAGFGVPVAVPGGPMRRQWMIVAAAVLAVAALVGLTRHAANKPVIQPVVYIPPAATSKPSPLTAPTPHPTGSWRVIAYTYSRFQDAAHKVATINQRHPDFHAEVFTPNGHTHGPFLVALGGRVTRAEAERLERRAKSQGLPRDTFARNYAN
jgi:hypothetical protein